MQMEFNTIRKKLLLGMFQDNKVKFLCRTEKLLDLHALQLACLSEGWTSTYKLYSLPLANIYS